MKKILVAYVTKTGTTQEVANEIASILEKNGLSAEVLAIKDLQKLEEYAGIVIGAPINGMKWLPEAGKFVEDNKSVLSNMPTALFVISYLFEHGRPFWHKKIQADIDAVKKKVNPAMVGVFGGRTTSRFPAPLRLLFGLPKDMPMDLRDWDAIRAWANELADVFTKTVK